MNQLQPHQIQHIKESYPPGMRIELTADMFGESISAATRGTVLVVDDIGDYG